MLQTPFLLQELFLTRETKMIKILLLIRGFFRSILEFNKKKTNLDFPVRTYFCYQNKSKMGVVMQQPHSCKVQKFKISNSQGSAVEVFMRCLYLYLNGLNRLNYFTKNKIIFVFNYYWYYLVIMNLDYWSKKHPKIAEGIRNNFIMLSTGNIVTIEASTTFRKGLNIAKRSTEEDDFRVE